MGILYCNKCDCAIHACTCKQEEMTTTKEDQIRAEFEAQNGYPVRAGAGYYHEQNNNKWEVWKACAETYEKKLAERDIDNRRLAEYAKEIDTDRVAAQLYIKELQKALSDCLIASGNSSNGAFKLLAKQPDTCALDKALLEAEIKVLEESTGSIANIRMVVERKAKLAELNKE